MTLLQMTTQCLIFTLSFPWKLLNAQGFKVPFLEKSHLSVSFLILHVYWPFFSTLHLSEKGCLDEESFFSFSVQKRKKKNVNWSLALHLLNKFQQRECDWLSGHHLPQAWWQQEWARVWGQKCAVRLIGMGGFRDDSSAPRTWGLVERF